MIAFKHLGAAACLLLGAASPVFAATAIEETWDFSSDRLPVSSGGYASSMGYTYTSYVEDGTWRYNNARGSDVKLSGWYASDPGDNWNDASANLQHWDGVGLNRDNDSHTIDNRGALEFVAIEFEEPVSLQSFKYGYVNGDSDTTIMYLDNAYTTDDDPNLFGTRASTALAGTTRNDASTSPGNTTLGTSMTAKGWRTIGSDPSVVWNPGTARTSVAAQTAGVFSYVWAVGASFFDSLYHSNWDGGKLELITTLTQASIPPQNEPGVPLPATAALMALGMLLMRRRRQGVSFLYTSR
ncbi:MAG: hypothetical protein ACI87W_002790 [Halieaceae bacterium]|jgi:hypothetical protein